MKKALNILSVAMLLLPLSSHVKATTVSYSLTDLGGGTGRYDYSISNDTLGFAIQELTIFFNYPIFATIGSLTEPNGIAPTGWDPLVVQPPASILDDDGFYDVLDLGGLGIAPGATLDGFSLEFDLLLGGIPGSQRFHVIDPISFETIETGITTLSPIPIPATIWLFVSGLFGLISFAKSKK